MRMYPNFENAITAIENEVRLYAALVPPTYWQSTDVSDKPEMATYEVRNVDFTVNMTPWNLEQMRGHIEPSIPWADNHFLERVCGEPINPGEQWAKWPYGNSADKFREASGQFNHNYMERYWPRLAGMQDPLRLSQDQNWGIRNRYGDLSDVIDLLVRDPLSRQAYVPIFFPEDTGTHHRGRIPCSLGYHLMRRNDKLHISYFMRSCDLLRHFRDDIYLTMRLCLWFIEQLRARDAANWDHVRPGDYFMTISSLHIFKNDWRQVFNEQPPMLGACNEYYQRRGPRPAAD